MNPDVHGTFFAKNIYQFLDDAIAVKSYNLVIIGGGLNDMEMKRAS